MPIIDITKFKSFVGVRKLSELYCVTPQVISKINTNKSWSWVNV